MKKHLLTACAAAAALTAAAAAETTIVEYNVDSVDSGILVDDAIALPSLISIDSITVDIANTWGGDIEMTLTSPTGEVFELMFDDVDQSGSGNFDMGLVAGDGTLGNVAPYTFVESGGFDVFDDSSGVAPAGIYNANSWASGGWEAGDWQLLINDDAGGDLTSIGSVTIMYTIPAPGALALLGLAGIAGGRRRRA